MVANLCVERTNYDKEKVHAHLLCHFREVATFGQIISFDENRTQIAFSARVVLRVEPVKSVKRVGCAPEAVSMAHTV